MYRQGAGGGSSSSSSAPAPVQNGRVPATKPAPIGNGVAKPLVQKSVSTLAPPQDDARRMGVITNY